MTEKQYAGFWVRFFAGFLDVIFLLPIFALFIYFFGFENFQAFHIINEFYLNNQSLDLNYKSSEFAFFAQSKEEKIAKIIFYILTIIYFMYFLAGKKQATWGKRLMGIYVGDLNGGKLSKAKAFCRALCSLLTSLTLGIGFIIVIFTKEKVSLHDFICKTRVFHGKF